MTTRIRFTAAFGITLVLTHCGPKRFTQNLGEAAASSAVIKESAGPAQSALPSSGTIDLLAGDACVATIEWHDTPAIIPYVSDQDCISRMRALVEAQRGAMLNFEIRHVTRDQLQNFYDAATTVDEFIELLERNVRPIYGFYSGWLNHN